MNNTRKAEKERSILKSAEKVFGEVGFRNAKMEDIASEAGITKVTLYSYFKSKENLYLAITYKALSLLTDLYYQTVDEHKHLPGIESSLALMKAFMDFCESNFLYSEALLDYFAMVRSSAHGKDLSKLTEAIQESLYFVKLQDIQNRPFKLSAQEIKRGQDDGSIQTSADPMLLTLQGWTVCLGYIKIVASNGDNATPLFNVDLSELKHSQLELNRELLSKGVLL